MECRAQAWAQRSLAALALLCCVLLVFGVSPAQARDVYVCNLAPSGAACSDYDLVDEATTAGRPVMACRGTAVTSLAYFGDCEGAGGSYGYFYSADWNATDLACGSSCALASTFPFYGGGGDPEPPGECESGDVFSCVDMSTFGQFFSAGFMLMFAFWCLGKGVGEVVKLFR